MRRAVFAAIAVAAVIGLGPIASAETGTFKDPRGRYDLSYGQDWKVLMNFSGMPSFFCTWEGCDRSTVAGCFFFAVGIDLPEKIPEEDYEAILLNSAYTFVNDAGNAAINGAPVSALQVEQIGLRKWAFADVEGSVLGVKTAGTMWVTLNHKVVVTVACKALPAKWPEYRTKFRKVIETVRLSD